MKTKVEYVWLDGNKPEPNLRSKVKIINHQILTIEDVPQWGFDGSSTNQAETGKSDCLLKPVRLYSNDFTDRVYVLCEVLDSEGKPHKTNTRSILEKEDNEIWFGFEQEYFIRKKPD